MLIKKYISNSSEICSATSDVIPTTRYLKQ